MTHVKTSCREEDSVPREILKAAGSNVTRAFSQANTACRTLGTTYEQVISAVRAALESGSTDFPDLKKPEYRAQATMAIEYLRDAGLLQELLN